MMKRCEEKPVLTNAALVQLNKVFMIVRGGKSARWKIVLHPTWPGMYALICDHPLLQTGTEYIKQDKRFIVGGSDTIEKTYREACDMTSGVAR